MSTHFFQENDDLKSNKYLRAIEKKKRSQQKKINSTYFTESKFQQHSTSFSLSYIDFPCWRDPILQWPLLLRYVNKNRDTRESVGPTCRSFLLQRGFAFPQAFTHVPIKYQDNLSSSCRNANNKPRFPGTGSYTPCAARFHQVSLALQLWRVLSFGRRGVNPLRL